MKAYIGDLRCGECGWILYVDLFNCICRCLNDSCSNVNKKHKLPIVELEQIGEFDATPKA